MNEIKFPTALHEQTVERIVNYFVGQSNIDTILLVNSLARGAGDIHSDIDMAILVDQTADYQTINNLENSWKDFLKTDARLKAYLSSNKFAQIHLDVIDGVFEEEEWEDGTDVNYFEVEIGNRLCYSKVLTKEGGHFQSLKARWLPYYDAGLQVERLNLSKQACLYEIEHIPLLVQRGLYFHAYDRLNVAFRKFLQTLFIKNKTYPIAYNKWIKEQIVGILGMPELYASLTTVFSIDQIESDEVCRKAEIIKSLLNELA